MAIDLQALLGYKPMRERNLSGKIWFVPFNITFRCELDCQFCYGKERTDVEMSTDEIKTHVIDNIASSGAKWIGFTGGDPLIRDDVFILMKYAKECGLEVILSTNGMLLNEERIMKLKEIGVNRVGIGISGLNDIYENVMGGGCFDTVDSALRRLVDEGFEVSLRSVVTKRNVGTFMELVDYAHELGVYKFCRYNMIYSGKASPDIDVSESEKDAITIFMIDKQREYPDLKLWLMERPYDNVLLTKLGFADTLDKMNIGKCGATKALINVAPNGDVYPCPYFHDAMEPIGNLMKHEISELALSDVRIQIENNLRGECGSCKYTEICGGCRYHSLKFGGDILGGDPFCPLK